MSILKIVGVAIVATAAAVIVKQIKPEIGIFIPIIAAGVIFIYAISELFNITQTLSEKAAEYGLNSQYMAVLFKSLGIAYITQFAADCCKDAGEGAIASKVELGGKIMLLSCALPVVLSVLEMINKVIEMI